MEYFNSFISPKKQQQQISSPTGSPTGVNELTSPTVYSNNSSFVRKNPLLNRKTSYTPRPGSNLSLIGSEAVLANSNLAKSWGYQPAVTGKNLKCNCVLQSGGRRSIKNRRKNKKNRRKSRKNRRKHA